MGKRPWQVQVITSEIVIQLAVARAYRSKPVDIITAAKSEQALSQIDVFAFDLFVLDLDFKDGCSLSLLKTMTERVIEAPVILLTTGEVESRPLIRQIEKIRPAGCWHLLEKPFELQKLSGFIERGLLERQSACCFKPDSRSLVEAEKRRCRRFSRHERINLLPAKEKNGPGPASETSATMTDISLGGFGVMTEQPLLSGQALHFKEKFMRQSGIVVWTHTEETGRCRAGVSFN